MAYTKKYPQGWRNKGQGGALTPANADAFDHIEDGIAAAAATADAAKAQVDGRLSEQALTATIAGVVPATAAAAMGNPESDLNNATIQVVDSRLGGGVEGMLRIVDARSNLSTARPIWSGQVVWLINEGDGNPADIADGDALWEVEADEIVWTPALLANKLAWLDAQQLDLPDASPVASWTDLSGNGNHFEQATAGAQPTVDADKINGHPAVVADGTNDILHRALPTALVGQAFTLYLVAGTDLADNPSGSDFLFSAKSAAGTAQKLDIYRTATEQYAITRGTAVTSPAAAWTTGTKIMRAVFNGANSSLTVDGTAQVPTSSTALAGIEVLGLSIFGRADDLNYFPGYIGEMLLVLGTVSPSDDAKVMAYLVDRWAA